MDSNCNSLFSPVDSNWDIMELKRRSSTAGHVLFEPIWVSEGTGIYF